MGLDARNLFLYSNSEQELHSPSGDLGLKGHTRPTESPPTADSSTSASLLRPLPKAPTRKTSLDETCRRRPKSRPTRRRHTWEGKSTSASDRRWWRASTKGNNIVTMDPRKNKPTFTRDNDFTAPRPNQEPQVSGAVDLSSRVTYQHPPDPQHWAHPANGSTYQATLQWRAEQYTRNSGGPTPAPFGTAYSSPASTSTNWRTDSQSSNDYTPFSSPQSLQGAFTHSYNPVFTTFPEQFDVPFSAEPFPMPDLNDKIFGNSGSEGTQGFELEGTSTGPNVVIGPNFSYPTAKQPIPLTASGQQLHHSVSTQRSSSNGSKNSGASEVSGNKYKCGICHKVFPTVSNRNRHEKTVHSDGLFPCEMCRDKLKSKDGLKRHKKRKHSKAHWPQKVTLSH